MEFIYDLLLVTDPETGTTRVLQTESEIEARYDFCIAEYEERQKLSPLAGDTDGSAGALMLDVFRIEMNTYRQIDKIVLANDLPRAEKRRFTVFLPDTHIMATLQRENGGLADDLATFGRWILTAGRATSDGRYLSRSDIEALPREVVLALIARMRQNVTAVPPPILTSTRMMSA